jgi:hypothetical protein
VELPLFEQVADAVRSMTPEDLGEVRYRTHRRGIKVWFDTDRAPREHYEAQVMARRHVDGRDGMALEIGFHSEHPDVERNAEVLAALSAGEADWREILGDEASAGSFFGAENWRRVSEAWIEPDLEDPELALEVASRLVDYLEAIEAVRRRP